MSSSFPLASFLITLLLAASVCTHGGEPVTDTDGDEVQINEAYFIQPVTTELSRGGLVPLAARVSGCSPGITGSLPEELGTPVSIAFSKGFIRDNTFVNTSLDITIEFKSNVCKDLSKFWQVDDFAENRTQPDILVGGSPRERNSVFKIEKAGEVGGINIYNFTTPVGTRTVGVPPGPYRTPPQLVLTSDKDSTLLVKFIKVYYATTHVTSVSSRVEKLGLRMIPFY
ncbi:unnamed protein product [Eruca vesicaria subsp. sativa]|uniref:Uncharacterized protein n=1 Tax=Eruca vesicaria subsp. sativa TaxID=29727 RepID=A0ABC8KV26_ERUVS|nr:unnamed protein product [Eruca vesicaria subsp. sativa]